MLSGFELYPRSVPLQNELDHCVNNRDTSSTTVASVETGQMSTA